MVKTSRYRAAALALLGTLAAVGARADVVMDWNARADAIAAEKHLSPPVQARALALMHVSIFEAINAIERRYKPYRLDLVADRNSSRETAAAVAGHTVLVAIYPDQRADLDALLAETLAKVADGPAKQRGLILGRRVGADLIEHRAHDFSEDTETYRPVTNSGVYVPTAIPVGQDVGSYTPWVMSSAAQFRPAPPPPLDSATWTRDLNEIREMGGFKSAKRTAEQTTIAKFWFLTGARTYNPILQQAAMAKKLDLLDCARLYALASMAAFDSFVAVFEAKYAFNFWRPVTAIRNADLTGNLGTLRDPSWLPLGETPMHPEYPCAHCISSSAVATVLLKEVGENIGEITVKNPSMPGVIRRWTKISDYRDEISNARVWAGFHYRFSTEVGKDMGRKIGELTVATQLRPRSARRKSLP